MKKNTVLKQLLAVAIIAIMVFGSPATLAYAAKEMFTTYEITSVAITGIDAPEAGKPFDFTAEESSQKYNIIKVAWHQQYGSGYITSTSSTAAPGAVYSVCIVLEVATPDHYFKTGDGRVSAVTDVTVNGQPAWANNAQDYELFSIDASKYEHDTTYKRFLCVWYTFPEVSGPPSIQSLDLKIDSPVTGESPATRAVIPTVNGMENVGYINIDRIEWNYQNGSGMSANTPFEYGESYTAVFYLTALWPREYATDPNHVLATPGNPFTAVTATVNGKAATVLPNGDASKNIIVAVKLTCDGIGRIPEASVSVTPPKAGESPNYSATVSSNKYTVAGTADRFTSGGVTWYNETDKKSLYVGIDKFESGKAYSVTVELSASEGYEFPTSGLTAKVNGQTAKTWGRESSEAFLSYTFEALKHICSPTKVEEKKATCTENGKKAHYFCSECGKYFEDSNCTKEIAEIDAWGVIQATDHTGGKATCVEKAKCKVCGVSYGEFAAHEYSKSWDYTDASGHAHKCKVNGCEQHDAIEPHTPGPAATNTSPQTCTVCKYVIAPADTHKHELTEVEKVSATCTTAGKKAYFYCKSCGGVFSNVTGTKKITDESTLVIPATGHKESKWKSDTEMHWKECNAKGCDVIIDGSKAGHEFGEDSKCTVCGYKQGDLVPETELASSEGGDVTEADTTEADTTEADTTETELTELPNVSGTEPNRSTEAPVDTVGADTTPSGKVGIGMWIAVIVLGVVAVASTSVLAVMLVKRKKVTVEKAEKVEGTEGTEERDETD